MLYRKKLPQCARLRYCTHERFVIKAGFFSKKGHTLCCAIHNSECVEGPVGGSTRPLQEAIAYGHRGSLSKYSSTRRDWTPTTRAAESFSAEQGAMRPSREAISVFFDSKGLDSYIMGGGKFSHRAGGHTTQAIGMWSIVTGGVNNKATGRGDAAVPGHEEGPDVDGVGVCASSRR